MKDKQVTYDNYTIGAKVVLNESGKKYTKEVYPSTYFDNVIYGIIIKHDDYASVIVDWYNHKGMKVLDYWYAYLSHMEYYEDN